MYITCHSSVVSSPLCAKAKQIFIFLFIILTMTLLWAANLLKSLILFLNLLLILISLLNLLPLLSGVQTQVLHGISTLFPSMNLLNLLNPVPRRRLTQSMRSIHSDFKKPSRRSVSSLLLSVLRLLLFPPIELIFYAPKI